LPAEAIVMFDKFKSILLPLSSVVTATLFGASKLYVEEEIISVPVNLMFSTDAFNKSPSPFNVICTNAETCWKAFVPVKETIPLLVPYF
jgi:hypothetical protein